MSYEKTKEYIINHYIKDAEYFSKLKEKYKKEPFSERVELYLNIRYVCKQLYEGNKLNSELCSQLELCNIQKGKDGWFYVDREDFHGKFINANAIFDDVICEDRECHSNAYLFAINYKGDDAICVSGIVNPYSMDEGVLHSVSLFNIDGKQYVFDGANYIIMDKDLYYNLFQFTEKQRINKDEMMADRVALSSERPQIKGVLKCEHKYKKATSVNLSKLAKRFSGLGFAIYLYDRKGTLSNNKSISAIEKENNEALKQLDDIINKINSEDDDYDENSF